MLTSSYSGLLFVTGLLLFACSSQGQTDMGAPDNATHTYVPGLADENLLKQAVEQYYADHSGWFVKKKDESKEMYSTPQSKDSDPFSNVSGPFMITGEFIGALCFEHNDRRYAVIKVIDSTIYDFLTSKKDWESERDELIEEVSLIDWDPSSVNYYVDNEQKRFTYRMHVVMYAILGKEGWLVGKERDFLGTDKELQKLTSEAVVQFFGKAESH
jgi:hypothetical protein